MLGIAKGIPIKMLEKFIPLGVIAFFVNMITGFIFIAGNPVGGPMEYLTNLSLQIKMLIVLIAGINLLLFYVTGIHRSLETVPADGNAPGGAKVVAAVSLVRVDHGHRHGPLHHVQRHVVVRAGAVRDPWHAERRVSWYVYIVRCADRTLYTGVAKDLRARIAAHNEGSRREVHAAALAREARLFGSGRGSRRRPAPRARDQGVVARGQARAVRSQLMTEKRRPSGRMIAFKKIGVRIVAARRADGLDGLAGRDVGGIQAHAARSCWPGRLRRS